VRSQSIALGRVVAVLAGVAVFAVALFLYIDKFTRQPAPAGATEAAAGGNAKLTLGTTPAVGSLGGEPAWVSYLKRRDDGSWDHTTLYELPANSLVDITIYQFDGATGLRNPFLSQVQGTVGGTMKLDGRTVGSIDPDETAHTFNVPDLGVVVPLPGVGAKAPNQCPQMPCSLDQAHRTIEFTIRTPDAGEYRYQCFVPCAAGFVNGNGGPMQTVGYMDGYLKVK
jgi:hypothetical protein